MFDVRIPELKTNIEHPTLNIEHRSPFCV